MGCEQWREALSARLDGEETAAEAAAAEAHLSRCSDCRRWFDQAAAVTRRARLSVTVSGDDLTDVILASLPVPEPYRLRNRIALTLRAVLGLIGALQLVLGLAQVGQGPAAGHEHAAVGALTSGHLWHESAAWNVAVGAGFLFVATRRTPPTGLVPMLTAFVGTLVLLSVNDLITGWVDPARLVSHGFLLAGYAIVVALSRPRLRPDGPSSRNRTNQPGWRLPAAEQETPPPPLRLLPPYAGSARSPDRWAA
ncbi:zf-HC2 domain-containing protein [Micromonospora sp. NBC_00898]|uniref:zf-HC2 domain-containing protein n=1 Tax=Micromonospora sp. NBC_00898 TaxID=2975981 RepID=UPI00386A513F|nr:zf-HC2 domain-containing protein [Micromonospora sp. NBC_00898]